MDYLRLDDPPSLEAHECARCGSLYFDRRNACAKCFATEFARRPLANEGVVKAFTIVHRAAPGVPAPYTSVIVALDGGGDVKANLLGVTDPSEIVAGLRVVLQTFVAGADDDGVEAVAFGYAPAGGAS